MNVGISLVYLHISYFSKIHGWLLKKSAPKWCYLIFVYFFQFHFFALPSSTTTAKQKIISFLFLCVMTIQDDKNWEATRSKTYRTGICTKNQTFKKWKETDKQGEAEVGRYDMVEAQKKGMKRKERKKISAQSWFEEGKEKIRVMFNNLSLCFTTFFSPLLVHSHMKQFPSPFLWSCYTGQTDEADEWNDKLHYITHEGVFSSSFSLVILYSFFFNRKEKRQKVSKAK